VSSFGLLLGAEAKRAGSNKKRKRQGTGGVCRAETKPQKRSIKKERKKREAAGESKLDGGRASPHAEKVGRGENP